ncbi:MerR family transcriptional regulator [Micromonospora matsumotoense]|uniref:MerR family transcriptional regulator n=1 Tax=Micromonospora matsumotoense TaxID=121616 RepID=UPI000B84B6DD|nr:MerR family transcriptional regulator [Micromonospora matsumotoense]
MRIGELARHCGVSPRSVRYYEQQRLIAPSRTWAGSPTRGCRCARCGCPSTVAWWMRRWSGLPARFCPRCSARAGQARASRRSAEGAGQRPHPACRFLYGGDPSPYGSGTT